MRDRWTMSWPNQEDATCSPAGAAAAARPAHRTVAVRARHAERMRRAAWVRHAPRGASSRCGCAGQHGCEKAALVWQTARVRQAAWVRQAVRVRHGARGSTSSERESGGQGASCSKGCTSEGVPLSSASVRLGETNRRQWQGRASVGVMCTTPTSSTSRK